MKPIALARPLFLLAVVALSLARPAAAADVRVMISAGFYSVYAELGPSFERASGHRLVTTRGPSMGDSPEAIPTRLARGEAADLVILDGATADELGQRGVLRADSKVELARSMVGMVVREGAALTRDAREPEAARALIRLLSSPEAAAAIARVGLAPPPGK